MSLWTWPFSLTAPEDSYPPRLWPRVGGVHSPPRHLNYPSCGQRSYAPSGAMSAPTTSCSTASDYSTARTAQCAFRGAKARRSALLTCNSTGRTAQCAHRGATARRSALHRPSYSQATARHARRSAHTGELQHGPVCYSTQAIYNAHDIQVTTGHTGSRAQ